ncbi:MAG: Ig domain-containing protein [Acidimicrobiales bacterium]
MGATLVTVAVVAPAYAADTTTTATTPTASTIVLGQSNTDSATVTGDATFGSPTGSVTFYECGPTPTPEPCTSTANQVGSPVGVTANGDDLTSSAPSSTFTPTSTGYWCFAGDYSGDPNYAASADNTTDECFDVTSASTTTVGAPVNSSITLGEGQADLATVTGNAAGGSPTGTVSFYECGLTAVPEQCTSTANPIGGPVDLSGQAGNESTATSATFTPNAEGYWCMAAVYSGDSNYNGSSDTSTDQCFYVNGPIEIVTTSPLPQATAGAPYSTGLEGRGGNPPYTWSHHGTRLPRGLKLNTSTGEIYGTPTRAGTYSFIIHIRDTTRGDSAAKMFSLTVVS